MEKNHTTWAFFLVFALLLHSFGFSQITKMQFNERVFKLPPSAVKTNTKQITTNSVGKLGGGINTILAGVCNNLDFEDGNYTAWTGGIGYNPNTNGPLTITSGAITTLGVNSAETSCSFHTLVNAGNDPYSGLPMVDPGGGAFACRLGGEVLNIDCDSYNASSVVYPFYNPAPPNISSCFSNDPNTDNSASPNFGEPFSNGETIQQTFPVTAANCLFSYSYAVVLSDAPHTGKENPYFSVQVFDSVGVLIPCLSYFVEADTTGAGGIPPGFLASASMDQLGNSVLYTPWTKNSLNLQPYIGHNVTVKFTAAGCTQGGHFCYAYIDGACSPLDLVIPSGPVCSGKTQTITGPPNGVGGTYSWSGPGIVSGATTQTITANQPGTYSVTVTNQKGCAYTIDTTITFYATPTVSVGNPTLCSGGSTTLTASSTGSAGTLTYSWNPIAGLTFSPGDSVATLTPAANTSYTITGTSIHGCTNTAVANVTVNTIPPPTFTAPAVCNGTAMVFTTAAVAGGFYSWNFGDLTTLADTSHTQNPTYLYPASGNYSVNFTVTTAAGCKSNTTQTVTVNPMPVLSITTTPACDQSAVTITNNTGAQGTFTVWAWKFGDGIGTSAAAAPGSYTYPAPGIYTVVLTATTSTGCSGTVTTTAIVHPNPIAGGSLDFACLGTASTFTDNSGIINPPGLTDAITTWNWNFGDGSSSPLPSPMHTYATCGSYSISLTVTTNFNCTDMISGMDTVYCIPNVTAPPSFSVCPATPVTSVQTAFTTTCSVPAYGTPAGIVFVNDNPTLPPYSYQTQTHGGIPLADTVDINAIPNYSAIAQNLSCGLLKDTIYGIAVTMDALGNIGCVGNMQTFTISVYPTPTVTPINNINVCANQTVNVPNFTGCPTPETFNWIATGANVGITAVSPANLGSFTGQNATNAVAVSQVSVTPVANGCTGASTTFSITVNPLPTLTVSSYTTCPNTQVPSPTITTNPAAGVNLAWTNNNINIGMAASGTGIPAAYTAPANATSADIVGLITYTPTLNGCIGTPATETIDIKPTPIVTPVPNEAYCPNQLTTQINFSCTPTGGTPTFSWTSPGGVGLTQTGSITPFITVNGTSSSIVNTFTVSATLNGCKGPDATFNITVFPNPIAKFVYKPHVCVGTPLAFTDESTVGSGFSISSWNWDMNGDGITDDIAQNPQYLISTPGSDLITLEVGTNSVPSCTAQVTETVFVNPKPVVNFVGVDTSGCSPLTTAFTILPTSSTDITQWSWNFGNGKTSTSQFPVAQTYTNNSALQSAYYSVLLTVVSDSGCVGSKLKSDYIEVYPTPIADFSWGPSNADITEPTITFINEAIGYAGYPTLAPTVFGANGIEYNLGDAIYSTATNPNDVYNTGTFNHAYNNPDPNDVTETYPVTQWVVNSYGCKDSIIKLVEILPIFDFYIPNAFSPNGDHKNEGFKGLGIGIDNTTYNLWIFDRWGLMIYHAEDIDAAWDGHMLGHEDRPILQQDVYVWKVKFNDVFGTQHDYHGTVTLLK